MRQVVVRVQVMAEATGADMKVEVELVLGMEAVWAAEVRLVGSVVVLAQGSDSEVMEEAVPVALMAAAARGVATMVAAVKAVERLAEGGREVAVMVAVALAQVVVAMAE